MNFDLAYILEALAIGFATGLVSGGFGIGGGILCTPLIRMVLGDDAHIAVGTSMALIIPTAIFGAFNYIRQGKIDGKLAAQLAPGAIIGTIAGAVASAKTQALTLMLLFSLLLAISGIDLSFGLTQKLKKTREAEDGKEDGKEEANGEIKEETPGAKPEQGAGVTSQGRYSNAGPLLLGLVSGLLAGFFGVGGGFIMIPAMLFFFRTPVKTAFGTSLIVVAALSMPGTVTHAMAGHVRFPLTLMMLAGSLPGSFIGSTVALKLRDSNLRVAFGLLMLLLALALAYTEITPED
ncbi:MAG TPA: sulfite exporter TauE/SafE family protein [Candidatus Obscuribacterales bacterium]